MEVFKEIENSDKAATSTSETSAWLFPEERADSIKLSSVGLSKKGEESAQRPGKQVSRYFYKVYDRTSRVEETEEAQYPQFTVTYGNKNGGGAPSFLNQEGNKTGSTEPTKAIYSQYADSLLDEGSFGFRRNHFYAINFSNRVLEKGAVPESFELTLSFGEDKITLVVGSGPEGKYPIYRKNPIFLNQKESSFVQPGDVLVSQEPKKENQKVYAPNVFASLGVPSTDGVNETGGRVYGFLYPKKGILILDPDMIAEEVSAKDKIVPETRNPSEILNETQNKNAFVQPGDALVTRKVTRKREGFGYEGGYNGGLDQVERIFPDWPYVRNHDKFFEAIKNGENLKLKVEKETVKNTYEIKIEETEFNHSTNPTYSDKSGHVTFSGDKPYYTTIGLYNDDKQLLAVAKLEEPTEKSESTLSIDIGY